MSRKSKLRNSAEFRSVYAKGVRYDGRYMTAFVSPNKHGRHRLGITASRKVALSAVRRNRGKRLLREAFRLSGVSLQSLQGHYDWVLNAKRALLKCQFAATYEDFQVILATVSSKEWHAHAADEQPRS